MHIVCPHCTTSYALNPATLGAAGRTVRCARCKEMWLARPEDAISPALVPALAGMDDDAEQGSAADWNVDSDPPVVDSPPIADGDFGTESGSDQGKADWVALVRENGGDDRSEPRGSWFGDTLKSRRARGRRRSFGGLSTACAAMAALIVALFVWRADVVRLMPQTADFYRMVGLGVNLRGIAFKDVRITTETVDGKPVLVIEGAIVGQTKKTVDLPRLRFSMRDAHGAEIYAWNTVLEQATLKPGEQAAFRSRLASPPAEGRSIDIRFFTKRDIAGGSV